MIIGNIKYSHKIKEGKLFIYGSIENILSIKNNNTLFFFQVKSNTPKYVNRSYQLEKVDKLRQEYFISRL